MNELIACIDRIEKARWAYTNVDIYADSYHRAVIPMQCGN
jgi:hypothetical protein